MSESHRHTSNFFILARNSLYFTIGQAVGAFGAAALGTEITDLFGGDTTEIASGARAMLKWGTITGLGFTILFGLIALSANAHGDDHPEH